MNRHLLILLALTAALICAPFRSADANGGRGHRGGHGHKAGFGVKGIGHGGGFGHHGGFGLGFGVGGCDDFFGYAELYRELLRNVPYYALHPPVYYSYPVPRSYGYSPFAYPPGVMTPELVGAVEPIEIINPYVDRAEAKPTKSTKSDRSAATNARVEPLLVINPFVAPNRAVAKADR